MKYNVGDYVRYNTDGKIHEISSYINSSNCSGMRISIEPVFDFDYYKDQKVVAHCDTEEKANMFCRLMHQNGMRWGNGSSYLENNSWHLYKDKTCYYFNEGAYDSISCIENCNYKIIEFDDIILQKLYQARALCIVSLDLM